MAGCCPHARFTFTASSRQPPPSRAMNSRRVVSSMGSPPEPAVPAYRRLRMPWKRPQVLGADLNRSESRGVMRSLDFSPLIAPTDSSGVTFASTSALGRDLERHDVVRRRLLPRTLGHLLLRLRSRRLSVELVDIFLDLFQRTVAGHSHHLGRGAIRLSHDAGLPLAKAVWRAALG